METCLFIGVTAVLLVFVCLYATVLSAGISLRSRTASLAAQGERLSLRALLEWRLRNGFMALLPLSEHLLGVGRINSALTDAVLLFESHGVATAQKPLMSVVLGALVVLSLVSGLVTGGVVGMLAVPACVLAILIAVMGNQSDKRDEAVREAVPIALESMSACFGSGFTLLQTFQQVALDVPDPLGSTFSRSAHVLEMGGSAQAALSELREGVCASELAFVAVALDVQHQSGGAMRQVLDAATETVKGELTLRRALRVQTAQAKLSARVVAVMPFILIAAFSLVSPDFLSPFFKSPAGYALLFAALAMQAGGIVLVRRALAVDGVS